MTAASDDVSGPNETAAGCREEVIEREGMVPDAIETRIAALESTTSLLTVRVAGIESEVGWGLAQIRSDIGELSTRVAQLEQHLQPSIVKQPMPLSIRWIVELTRPIRRVLLRIRTVQRAHVRLRDRWG